MGQNAPPGADMDSRAPWYSEPIEKPEREYEPEEDFKDEELDEDPDKT